jgi:dihydroneopterin aldolase
VTDHPRAGTPDRIAVRGLTAHAHHGVYGFERENGQTFSVDAVLDVDTAAAAATDDLALTVNYAELAQRLHAVLAGEPVDLLETLCQRLADVCLADPLVQAAEITVHKPQAELGVPFDDVTVTIRRVRAGGPGSPPDPPARPGPLRRADVPRDPDV